MRRVGESRDGSHSSPAPWLRSRYLPCRPSKRFDQEIHEDANLQREMLSGRICRVDPELETVVPGHQLHEVSAMQIVRHEEVGLHDDSLVVERRDATGVAAVRVDAGLYPHADRPLR